MSILTNLLYAQSDSAFRHSLWDRFDYLSLLEFSEEIEDADTRDREDRGRSFVADAVFALGGCEPDPDDRMGRAWDEVIKDPRFEKIKGATTDRLSRATAVMRLADMAREALDKAENPERYTDTQPPSGTDIAPTCPSCGSDRLETIVDSGFDPPLGLGYRCRSCGAFPQTQAHTTRQDGESMVVSFGDTSEELEKLEAQMVLVRAIGAGLDGPPGGAFERALDLSELFDATEFAKMLGWTKHTIGGEARKGRGVTGEMTGYDIGQWSDKVVPRQMLGLAEGDLATMAALADNALTRRKYDAETDQGRGPVILLRDESGSMRGGGHHPTALSFELALASVFNKEGRDLVSVAWSSGGIRTHIYGEPGLDDHLQAYLGGGTKIQPALEEAIRIANEYLAKADVLVLTDGKLHATVGRSKELHELVEEFRRGGGRIWAVSLAVQDERLGWTDGSVHLDELRVGDAKMGEILRSMTRDNKNTRRVRL